MYKIGNKYIAIKQIKDIYNKVVLDLGDICVITDYKSSAPDVYMTNTNNNYRFVFYNIKNKYGRKFIWEYFDTNELRFKKINKLKEKIHGNGM